MHTFRLTTAVVVAAAVAAAQGLPTVTISDFIRTPFGQPFTGRVNIALRYSGPLSAGTQTLVPGFIRLNVSNGSLTVSLVPNTIINPPGTSYSVNYYSTNGFSWEETWVVPDYPTTTTVSNVRVSTIPTPLVVVSPQQISTAGASPGQVLVYNGSTVSWASVSGVGGGAVWGSITGLLSNQQDLWSVLGSKANVAHTHSLSDMTQSGASVGQVPVWNGTSWVPTDPPSSGSTGPHTHSTSDIVSGVFDPSRLGSGDADSTRFLRGDQTWARVSWADVTEKPNDFPPSPHSHSGSDITSGTVPAARLGSGTPTASTFLRGDQQWDTVKWADVSNKPSEFPPSPHSHSAADLTSGVVATARLGAGTASSSTFLRGDQTWAPVPVTSVFGRTGSVVAAAGDYTASQITNEPSGSVSATTVQGAINELDVEKAPVVHSHSASDITSGTIATARLGAGTASASTFLRGDQQWVSIGWDDVSGKPTSFPPNAHSHSASEITTGLMAAERLGNGAAGPSRFLRGDQQWAEVGWSQIAGKPTTFPPSNHTHSLDELGSGGAAAGQVLMWNGSQWAPASITTENPNYSQSFTLQTTVTLAHNAGTTNVIIACYDSSDSLIIPQSVVVSNANQATVTFGSPTTGRCVVNSTGGSGGGGGGLIYVGTGLIGTGSPTFPIQIDPNAGFASQFYVYGNVNFGVIPAGSCLEATIPAAGMSPSMSVAPAWPASIPQGLVGMMYTGSGVLVVRLCNVTQGDIDPPELTYGGRVIGGM